MTEITAHARNIRQSVRKVRLVVGVIRGMSVVGALSQLSVMVKAARGPVEKLLRSAIANAENNFQKNASTLFIKGIQVNQGKPLKRWRPRAFGRAAPLKKHACSISIVLGEIEGASAATPSSRRKQSARPPAVDGEIVSETLPHGNFEPSSSAHSSGKHPAPFDKTRAGRHETAQKMRKEKKVSMLKKIIQRKTG